MIPSSQTLWPDLLSDLDDPGLRWQILVVLACMAAGWALSRLLVKTYGTRGAVLGASSGQVGSFLQVVSPLVSVILISLAIPIIGHWQHVGLLRVALPLFISFLLIRFVFFLLRRAFVRGGRVGNILVAFEKGIALIVWAGVATYITGLWPEVLLFLEDTTVPIGRHRESLLVISQAVLSVAVTLVLALWAGAALEQRLMALDSMHSSLRVVLARVGRATLILVAVLLSLSLVGLDLTVLSVFGGALGVGIGLGLQKLVSSYVSGFVILLERSLSIGDLVSVDKYQGRVEEIRTRYTVLRSSDGVESVIPNEMLVSGPVQNLSLTDNNLRLVTRFTLGYETDINPLFLQLEQAIATLPYILQYPAPSAWLSQLGPDGLGVEIGFWIAPADKKNQSPITSEVNRKIWQILQEFNVKIRGNTN